MPDDTSTTPAPPEPIRAVPVRHPGRWIATAVIAVLAAMFVHMLVTNPVFRWDFMVDNMFSEPVLRGARTTLVMTVLAMVIGIVLGIGAPRGNRLYDAVQLQRRQDRLRHRPFF